jgi:hypothetical protein
LASIVLDIFCVEKAGGTKTFRGPYNLWERNWDNPQWPTIRPRAQDGRPVPNAEGVVIYTWMIAEEVVRHLPGYAAWKATLYEDAEPQPEQHPIDDGTASDATSLQDACQDEAFRKMNLYQKAAEVLAKQVIQRRSYLYLYIIYACFLSLWNRLRFPISSNVNREDYKCNLA